MLANNHSPENIAGNSLFMYEDEELDDLDDLGDFDDEDFEDDLYGGDDFNGNGDYDDFLDDEEEEEDDDYTH